MIHNYEKINNPIKLDFELRKSSVKSKLVEMNTSGNSIIIETGILDAGEQIVLDDLITAHDATTPDMNRYIQLKIEAAMDFGKSLMSEYGARNVIAGKTVTEVRAISDKLKDLQGLLLSGSLYVALDEISQLTPDTLITQTDLNEFSERIQTYLGL